jgi:hypothetical protein
MGPKIRGQGADVDFHARIILSFSDESKSRQGDYFWIADYTSKGLIFPK